jgi:hypothetical protein
VSTAGGRFELRGDPQAVRSFRQSYWKMRPVPTWSDLDHRLWISAVDRHSGAEVRIQPRRSSFGWSTDVEDATVARRVQALALPGTVPVLHPGPGIVFAAPPGDVERPRLLLEQAAACAIEACEVAAWLHAAGIDGWLAFDPVHLRVVLEDGQWHARWLVPGLEVLAGSGPDSPGDDRREERRLSPVQRAARKMARFLGSLCPHPEAAKLAATPAADMASLARQLLAFTPSRPDLARRVEALPVVRKLPPRRHEWDWIIDDGEALLAHETHHREYITLPLAAAYHQRASRSFGAGDRGAALRDVDRALALDPYLPYRTTRAVVLDALGRTEESRREIALAVDAVHKAEESRRAKARQRRSGLSFGMFGQELAPADAELARALVVHVMFALRDGAPEPLEPHLRRALELHPTPLAERLMKVIRSGPRPR